MLFYCLLYFLPTVGYSLVHFSNFKTEPPYNVVSSVRNVPLFLSVPHKEWCAENILSWFMRNDYDSWLLRFIVKQLNLKNKGNQNSKAIPCNCFTPVHDYRLSEGYLHCVLVVIILHNGVSLHISPSIPCPIILSQYFEVSREGNIYLQEIRYWLVIIGCVDKRLISKCFRFYGLQSLLNILLLWVEILKNVTNIFSSGAI